MAERPQPYRSTIRVPRTAHFASFGSPGPGTNDLWLVFHGYRQLAHRFIRGFSGLATPGRAVVAPEGLTRFYVRGDGAGTVGASWMTREDRLGEIADYQEYLDLLWNRMVGEHGSAPGTVTMLGFSQGVATAFRWAARGGATARALIAWGSFPPPDLSEEDFRRLAAQETRVILVVGSEDRFTPVAGMEDVARQYQARGLPAEVRVFSGGHEIDPATVMELAELLERD